MVVEFVLVVLAVLLGSLLWHGIEHKIAGDEKPHDLFPHVW
jgi:hypothetical protein